MPRLITICLALLAVSVLPAADLCSPWVTSSAPVSAGQPMPNVYSMPAFHASPAFKGLAPKEFCRALFEIYYDGRRKDWTAFQQGMTLWAHTPQEPRANAGVIELDPVLLLNVHGTGYCGIQSGLLEGIYQSRPGGTPGKPAIEARRWFLAGIVHSVCDAFYDGKWHYYDIDLGGWGGDAQRDVWSVADVIADPKGYYGAATTIRSKYFYGADRNGAWVDAIDGTKSYTFQDNQMLGHEMAFSLRPGETLTRWFGKAAAGWEEFTPDTKTVNDNARKGFAELVYAPPAGKAEALTVTGDAAVYQVRLPYNITSSRVECTGTASVSTDLGRTWVPLSADGTVPQAVNHWDYLLKIEKGGLTRVTTRGILHPAALPRVGREATAMTVACAAPYRILTWVPDWSSVQAFQATAQAKGLTWSAVKESLNGGGARGAGTLTVAVPAPPGSRIVKLAAMVIGGTSSTPAAANYLELHLGPAGKAALVERSTDCSGWGTEAATRVDHAQTNVSGAAEFPPCEAAEVVVAAKGYAGVGSLRIYVGYVPETPAPAAGTLVITHGVDGKAVGQSIPAAKLAEGPVTYTVPGGQKNEFIRMELK